MKVVPGNARTVVIATARHLIGSGTCAFNQPDEAAVFQDGIKLPNALTLQGVHRLEFSDSPSLLFGLNTFSPGGLSRISVTASGLSLIDSSYLANYPGGDFKFLNGRIYTASGHVYDGYTRIGSFTNSGVFSLRPDPVRNRLFVVTDLTIPGSANANTVATIQAYDPVSLTLLGSVEIPNLGNPAVPPVPRIHRLSQMGHGRAGVSNVQKRGGHSSVPACGILIDGWSVFKSRRLVAFSSGPVSVFI